MEKTDDLSPARERMQRVPPVYVTVPAVSDDRIDLRDLWQKLLKGKWIAISIVVIFVISAIAYSLLATPLYRSEVLLAPVTNDPMRDAASRLGGIASLAGINLGSAPDNMHAVAVLQSDAFIADFIKDENLLPILFAHLWDEQAQRWHDQNPAQQPDVRDGVRFFKRNVRTVSEEGRTGLVTLAIEWTDPELAAAWATKLVARVNERIRAQDVRELEQKLNYLNEQLEKAHLVELRQAISRLIEEQVNAMMMAQARTEYAFKVIDPAVVPKIRSWPNRTLIVMIAGVLGTFLGMFAALVYGAASSRRPT